jgi:hypothetical protein
MHAYTSFHFSPGDVPAASLAPTVATLKFNADRTAVLVGGTSDPARAGAFADYLDALAHAARDLRSQVVSQQKTARAFDEFAAKRGQK